MQSLTEIKEKVSLGFRNSIGQQPVYCITSDGIRVEYFNLDNEENLPFDRETYAETQIFLGDYANPWYVDIDAIKDEYSEFKSDEPITNLVENRHVIPSQKYKAYMNQTVLTDSFSGGAFSGEKVKYLLYVILGATLFTLLVVVT